MHILQILFVACVVVTVIHEITLFIARNQYDIEFVANFSKKISYYKAANLEIKEFKVKFSKHQKDRIFWSFLLMVFVLNRWCWIVMVIAMFAIPFYESL
ncbi:hypothetical protein [Ekhidna sp.]